MGGLRVFNTMSKRKEPFRPLAPGRARMFVCGPTVQGPIHLGHARTYIFYDVLARYLARMGLKVDFLVNVTDVDEKITASAREAGEDPLAYAARYTKMFREDLEALGVASVTRYELVSDHVDDAVRLVSKLIAKGAAYPADGWVYFDTRTFPKFGALSGLSKAELALHPLELSIRKRNLSDFSLWRPDSLVPGKWRSPWGMGSPGWHIQDTAITTSVFGPAYDIHGGAYELVFPHHEAEIAQGESLSGVSPMVRYWVHTHLVTTGGEKMSKSVGNVYHVRDALKRYSSDELRFYFLETHYREDMDLSGLAAAARRLGRIKSGAAGVARGSAKGSAGALLRPFIAAMDDDFDTPRALDAVESIAEGGGRRGAREALTAASGILGIGLLGR